jgi:hypothetical protein
MKHNLKPTEENEELLKTISGRQLEIEKMTTRMTQLVSRAKQVEHETSVAHKWFEVLKNNNANILSKAV